MDSDDPGDDVEWIVMEMIMCDRCGEIYKPTSKGREVTIATKHYFSNALPRSQKYDVCPSCTSELQAFMQQEKS